MAPGMKWLGVTSTLCAAVAFLAFRGAAESVDAVRIDEPVIDESGNRVWQHPLVQRVWTLSDELMAARIVYNERAAFDSGYVALPAQPELVVRVHDFPAPRRPTRDSVAIARIRLHYDSVRAAFFDSVAAQMAGAPSRARIALVQARTAPDSAAGNAFFLESDPVRFFAGADDRGGYCIATFAGPDEPLSPGSPLGPCRLWARYGPPSPQVLAWLARSGHLLEFDSVVAYEDWDYFAGPHGYQTAEAPEARRRGLFGIRRYDHPTNAVALGAQGCLAGRREDCVDAAFDADSWRFRRSRVASDALQYRARYATLETIGGFFGDLERELGRERFERFWTGATAPEAELGAALGAPFDEWTQRWLIEQFGAEPQGPRTDAVTLLLSFGTIAALLGVALITARRRSLA